MYKKNTFTVTRKPENTMNLKGFLMRITILLVVVFTTVMGTGNKVHGKTLKTYEKCFSQDMRGTDLNKKKVVKVKNRVNRKTYKPNRVYTENIKGVGNVKVMYVKNRSGREKMFRLLERRTTPVVVIECGVMTNKKGDGITTDGCYIGYRYGRCNSKTMKFKQNKVIKTICISPGTDQYTDTICYRYDQQK